MQHFQGSLQREDSAGRNVHQIHERHASRRADCVCCVACSWRYAVGPENSHRCPKKSQPVEIRDMAANYPSFAHARHQGRRPHPTSKLRPTQRGPASHPESHPLLKFHTPVAFRTVLNGSEASEKKKSTSYCRHTQLHVPNMG